MQDGKQQALGPEDFVGMLHEAGANQRLATEAWVTNAYCWAVWKLAAYEETYTRQLQGKLLTQGVVLDQLKYRSAHYLLPQTNSKTNLSCSMLTLQAQLDELLLHIKRSTSVVHVYACNG